MDQRNMTLKSSMGNISSKINNVIKHSKIDAELEKKVGHLTFSDHILNMSGQFHIVIGHNV